MRGRERACLHARVAEDHFARREEWSALHRRWPLHQRLALPSVQGSNQIVLASRRVLAVQHEGFLALYEQVSGKRISGAVPPKATDRLGAVPA